MKIRTIAFVVIVSLITASAKPMHMIAEMNIPTNIDKVFFYIISNLRIYYFIVQRCKKLFRFYHSVPDADVSLNILRRIGGRFDFFAQSRHKYAQRSDVAFPCRAPYFLPFLHIGKNSYSLFG